MRKSILIEPSTFNDLAKLSIPLEDDADSVIVRLIKLAKKNGHKAPTKSKGKALPGRGKGTPNGIGARIGELIKEGWNNKKIYRAMKKEFPKSRIKGPASVLWYRSKFKKKTPGKVAPRPGALTRKTHPDKLSKFIRTKYSNMSYWAAAEKAFIEKGRQRLGVLSLVNMIFDIPATAQKADRINRAVRSMTVALRGYNDKKVKRIFNEPSADVFELRPTK